MVNSVELLKNLDMKTYTLLSLVLFLLVVNIASQAQNPKKFLKVGH